MAYSDLLLYQNPRRRHSRRNPKIKELAGKALSGANVNDIVAGLAGLAAAYVIPPMVIKLPETPAPTEDQIKTAKWQRLLLSAGLAAGAGMVAKYAKLPAKSVVIGGMSGVAAMALTTYVPQFKVTPYRQIAAVSRPGSDISRTLPGTGVFQ